MEYDFLPRATVVESTKQSKVMGIFTCGILGKMFFKRTSKSAMFVRNVLYFIALSEYKYFTLREIQEWIRENGEFLVEMNLLAIREEIIFRKKSEQDFLNKKEEYKVSIEKTIYKDFEKTYLRVLKDLVYEEILRRTTKAREMGGVYFLFFNTNHKEELKLFVELGKIIR